MTALTSIRNIGPAFAQALSAVGITTAEKLYETGADAAYVKLLEAGSKPHFIGYYVLHMALQGRPWNDCKGDEKKALRKRFDAIKATSFDDHRSEFERTLDHIGVGQRMEKRED
ncbi:TfoX/Sxy family protein [Yoonia sediminilitoris]|uniref:TfoX-like protein n=1 Tax=Yoonia sediminilitoris TaxID=1286148 RepID=A0A2T6KCZ0_9RHOB|nr:TfoX/Sxy family protein [Yoonia sediminilitoris]PUB12768.1 TfoX-like protein [Yoonia sediminilitoris]RCW94247.1 TfoX-like protein [Yoonia sediminilitoris]